MRLCTLPALCGVALAAVHVERTPTPGVVALPFSRSLQKRDAFVNVDFGATYAQYIVNITVGTPPQPITLSLDTGSSNTILIDHESSFCVINAGYCPATGYYNANKSSTYKYLSSNFSSQFGFSEQGQGSGASGDVALDTFQFGGTTLKNQEFDIAYGNATIAFSILGLSYASGEGQYPYDNFPLALAKSGATNLAAFSLWKDTVSSHDGQVLFGGVDTTKYTGSLLTLPTQTRPNFTEIVAFDVLLNGVALGGNSSFPAGNTGSVLHVLDCGTAYSLLPDDWVQPIHDEFNVTYFPANDTAYVDCALLEKDYTVDFTFDTLTIKVPMSYLVSLVAVSPNRCTFGLVPAGSRIALLGDNFLSSAYTVFDITNNQISLAARDFSSTSDNVVAIPSGGVKNISPSASGTTLAPTPTPSASPTGTGEAPAATTSKKSGAEGVRMGGLAVVVPLGVGLIGLL